MASVPPARWDSGGVGIQAEERKKEMHHRRARPVVAAGVVDPAAPSSHEGRAAVWKRTFIHWEVSSIGLLPLPLTSLPLLTSIRFGDPKI